MEHTLPSCKARLFSDKFLPILSLRHMTLVFLLDYLHFNKLLEILPSVWSNLLKCNPAEKQASYARF